MSKEDRDNAQGGRTHTTTDAFEAAVLRSEGHPLSRIDIVQGGDDDQPHRTAHFTIVENPARRPLAEILEAHRERQWRVDPLSFGRELLRTRREMFDLLDAADSERGETNERRGRQPQKARRAETFHPAP